MVVLTAILIFTLTLSLISILGRSEQFLNLLKEQNKLMKVNSIAYIQSLKVYNDLIAAEQKPETRDVSELLDSIEKADELIESFDHIPKSDKVENFEIDVERVGNINHCEVCFNFGSENLENSPCYKCEHFNK